MASANIMSHRLEIRALTAMDNQNLPPTGPQNPTDDQVAPYNYQGYGAATPGAPTFNQSFWVGRGRMRAKWAA